METVKSDVTGGITVTTWHFKSQLDGLERQSVVWTQDRKNFSRVPTYR